MALVGAEYVVEGGYRSFRRLVTQAMYDQPLPHRLVQAFRATLEETVNASLLLHVTDSSVEESDANVAAVNEVLEEKVLVRTNQCMNK